MKQIYGTSNSIYNEDMADPPLVGQTGVRINSIYSAGSNLIGKDDVAA